MNYNVSKKTAKHKSYLLAFFIGCVTLFSSYATAQQTELSESVSINKAEGNLLEVIRDLDRQTVFSFSYSQDQLERIKVKALSFKNVPLSAALKILEDKYKLVFSVQQKTIAVRLPKQQTIESASPNAPAGQGNGGLKGRIVEFETSQPLPGASVFIVELKKGVQSDESGYYKFTGVPAGKYTLQVSFISFTTEKVAVIINAGKEAIYDVKLQGSNQLTEVVVKGVGKSRAPVAHTTEKQLLEEIKNMSLVASGISSQQISMSADRNAAQAVQRVSGVSIVDDKFVIVRGLNPRYNLTYLNDNVAPPTEIYSRAFAMDLIPSRVIDRILVYKSPSPENQADATGGVVKIYTKDAKSVKHFDVELQGALRTGSSFKNMLTHSGGNLDFLGFDDGTRKLPSSVPGYGSLSTATIAQNTYLRSFSPVLWHNQAKASPNAQLTANYYNNFKLGKKYLSMLSSLSYKHEEQVMEIYRQQGILKYAAMDANDKINQDVLGTQTSQLNLLQNFSYQLQPNHTLYFKNFVLQTGTSTNTERLGYLASQYSLAAYLRSEKDIILSYNQRFLYAGNLGGTHSFDQKKHQLKWNAGYSYTKQQTPDQRVIRYEAPGPKFAVGDPNLLWTARVRQGEPERADIMRVQLGSISRTWMSNTDDLYNFSADYSFKVQPSLSLHAGTFQQFKRRHFYRRIYTVNEGDLTGNMFVDSRTYPGYNSEFMDPNIVVFNQQHIHELWSDEYLRENGTGLKVYDRTAGSDMYVGTEQNNSGYASFSFTPFNKKIEIYGGVRAEYNRQRIGAAIPPRYENDINMPVFVDYHKLDWFPSVNFKIQPAESWIFRGGWGKTINRPEFRETSPFQEINYDANQLIYGNIKLVPARAKNYDFRVEFYPRNNQSGETISAGLFYKQLDKPIERINSSVRANFDGNGLPTNISYANADHATIKGIEVELRKSFDFIPVKFFRQLSFVANGSIIKSEVKGQQYIDGANGEVGLNVDRRLQGQAPYLVNAGFYYDNAGSGTKISFIYNIVGERIYATSTEFKAPGNMLDLTGGLYRGSLIELPRQMLDMSITQRIGKGIQGKFSVQNLLNKPIETAEDFNYTYKYEKYREDGASVEESGDNISSRFNPGRYFQFSLSYSF